MAFPHFVTVRRLEMLLQDVLNFDPKKVAKPYPLSKITCFLGSFSLGVVVAKHFSARIPSLLSLLSTFACRLICWRSLNETGKSSWLYAVSYLQNKRKVSNINSLNSFSIAESNDFGIRYSLCSFETVSENSYILSSNIISKWSGKAFGRQKKCSLDFHTQLYWGNLACEQS